MSVDDVEHAARMKVSAAVDFDVLSDPEGTTLDLFGIRHEDGLGTLDLAQSATFLLDRSGTVVWRRVAENYRVRPEPREILEAAGRLLD